MSSEDKKHRSHLPMPNTERTDVHHLRREGSGHQIPADRAVAPARGRAERADHPHRRRRIWVVERLRRPLPDAERGEARGGRPEVQPLPHHRPLLADAAGAADRAQSPLRRHGRHHRDRHRRAGLLLGAAEHHVAAGPDAEAQRLLDGAVRQMPRSAGVGDEPGRAVRCLAHRRRRLRVLLRLHRRRGEPVVPDAVRGHHAGRAEEDARRGLPLDGRHDRQGDGLDLAAEGARSGQAVLRLLRARRHPRAAPRPKEWADKYKGKFDAGLGQAARRDHSPGRRSWASSRRTASSPRATRRSRHGTRCRRRSSRSCAARWRSTRASWSTPTIMSAGCSTA